MKRRDLLLAVPGVVLTAGLAGPASYASIASAQDRPSAREVADAAHAYYRARRTVQARFAQTARTRMYDRTVSSRGRVVIEQPGKIRMDYDAPNGQVIASDGASWIWYQPFAEGGPGQYSTGSVARSNVTALEFLMGTVDLDLYRCSLLAPSPDHPPRTQAVQLVPTRPGTHERRLVIYVDDAAGAERIVRRVLVEDPDRNTNRYDFTDVSFDGAVDASTFRFRPPPGARHLTGA